MLITISPAKNLDYTTPVPIKKTTKPAMLADSEILACQMKTMAPHDLSKLMGISDKLGTLNYDRYQAWQNPMPKDQTRQAILAFKGDVYVGLNAYEFSLEDFEYAQQHLRILSGLYGLLKPLDSMMPYRLEMGTKLQNERGRDLYSFWGSSITKQLNKQLRSAESDVLVNLASNEYFKSVQTDMLNAKIITPIFKDWKNGQYKVISFFAKKARGLMSAYIIKNRLSKPDQLENFDWEGYTYNDAMSDGGELVFTRKKS